MAREASFGKNAALNVVAWLVPAIAAFLCLPITVRGLGPSPYGLITLAAALTSYIGLLDLGLGQALVRYLSHYRVLNEGRPMYAIMRVAIIWFTGAGVLATVVLILAAPWLAQDLLHVSERLLPTAVIVIRVSAVTLVLSLLIGIGTAVPVSFLRYDIAATLTCIFSTVGWVGPAAAVVLGWGVVGVALVYMVSNAVALVVYFYFGRRLLRTVRRDAGPEWREIRKDVLSFAGLVAANRIGWTVAAQTNRLITGITNGTNAAGYYQVPSVLASKLTELLNRIAQVLFPTGSAMLARDDHEGVRTLYLRSSRLLFLINVSMAMPIGVFAYPLLAYWVSPLYAEKGSVALGIFIATQALNACSLAVGFLSWAAGKAGINLFFSSLNSAINLAAIYPLATRFGVAGAAAAGLLGALTTPFFIHRVGRRILQVSSFTVFRRCYLPSLAGALVAGVASFFFLVPLAHNLLTTFVLLVVSALLAMGVSGLFGAFTRADVKSFAGLLTSVWRRLARR